MSRGKRTGFNGRFHSYNCEDRKNCSGVDYDKRGSYALSESLRKRKEKYDATTRNPELSRKYSWIGYCR